MGLFFYAMTFAQIIIPIVITSGGPSIDFENMSEGGQLVMLILYSTMLLVTWAFMGLVVGYLSCRKGWRFWLVAAGWPAVIVAALAYALRMASKDLEKQAADER